MCDVLACRICLLMDVQLYNLRSSPLDDYFECVFGVNPHTHELLTYLCVECAVLVKKYFLFREKCIRGLNVLQDILTNQGKVTKEDIQTIDRKHHNLTSTITTELSQNIHVFYCTSYNEPSQLEPFHLKQPQNTIDIVKQEIIENDCVSDKYTINDDDISTEIKEEVNLPKNDKIKNSTKNNINIKKDVKPKVVRKQNVIIKTNFDEDRYSDDDFSDELPLAVEQRKKLERDAATKVKKKEKISKRTLTQRQQARKTKVSKAKKSHKLENHNSVEEDISDHFDVIVRTFEEQKAEIKARELTAEYQEAFYKCNLCFLVFKLQSTLEIHMKKHDPSSGPVQCQVCGLRFRSYKTMDNHRRIHSRKFICKLCHLEIRSRDQAQDHKIWHTGVTHTCKHCLEKFSHKTTYLSHMRIKHPSQFTCNICGYTFLNEMGLQLHKTKKHKGDKVYSADGPNCEKCDIQFVSQEAFDRHLFKSSNHIDVSHYSLLYRHHTRPSNNVQNLTSAAPKWDVTWPKKCDNCDEMVPSGRENWFHHQRAHPDKEYVPPTGAHTICEVCGYKTTHDYKLKYHMIDKHSSEQPYSCPECPKTFGTALKLKMHSTCHSDERPYPCSVCSKPFKNKSNLMNHERTHSDVRPFSCPFCSKTFRFAANHKLHIRHVHHKVPGRVRKRKHAHTDQ